MPTVVSVRSTRCMRSGFLPHIWHGEDTRSVGMQAGLGLERAMIRLKERPNWLQSLAVTPSLQPDALLATRVGFGNQGRLALLPFHTSGTIAPLPRPVELCSDMTAVDPVTIAATT